MVAPPARVSSILDEDFFFAAVWEKAAVNVPKHDTLKVFVFYVAKIT